MSKPNIAERLRAAGFNPTPEQIAQAERAFGEGPSAREIYLQLRETNPWAAAEYAAQHPEAYEVKK